MEPRQNQQNFNYPAIPTPTRPTPSPHLCSFAAAARSHPRKFAGRHLLRSPHLRRNFAGRWLLCSSRSPYFPHNTSAPFPGFIPGHHIFDGTSPGGVYPAPPAFPYIPPAPGFLPGTSTGGVYSAPPAFPHFPHNTSAPALVSSAPPEASRRKRARPNGAPPSSPSASCSNSSRNSPALADRGQGLTTHVIFENAGEDIHDKLITFSGHTTHNICILSAPGSISHAVLGGNITLEGQYEILELSGCYVRDDSGGVTGGFSVSLSNHNTEGQIIGGLVNGPLMAARPVQVEEVPENHEIQMNFEKPFLYTREHTCTECTD